MNPEVLPQKWLNRPLKFQKLPGMNRVKNKKECFIKFEPLPTAPNLWLTGLRVQSHLATHIVTIVELEHVVTSACTAQDIAVAVEIVMVTMLKKGQQSMLRLLTSFPFRGCSMVF